jgi:ureidoacrylate peracid hydrolase
MARISRLTKDLRAQTTGLVLFDALNGYLHPADPTKVHFLAERHILLNLQRLLAGARKVGMTTFYPSGRHAPGGHDTVARLTDTDMDLRAGGGSDAPIKPPFHGDSHDAKIAPELAPAPGDVVVPKQRWSAFHQTNLDLQLRARGIDTIVIAGGSTDVGVASTAFSARDLDYGVVIVKDACYSARGNNNEFFMERVFPRMSRVRTVDETIALMTE